MKRLEQQAGFSYTVTDDYLVIVKLQDLRRETVDAFVEVTAQLDAQAAAAGRHHRTLLDVSELSMPTPYAIKRVQESISNTPKDLVESYAIVTPAKPIYTFARTVVGSVLGVRNSSIRVFTTEDDARAWLEDRLQTLGP